MTSKVREAISHFFFFPTGPRNLALLRIIFFGFLLFWHIFSRLNFPAYAATDKILEPFWFPGELFSLLDLKFPSVIQIQILRFIYSFSLILVILGFLTRFWTKIALLSGWYCISLPYQFGFQPHYLSPHLLILLVFAFARCGDAISLDNMFFHKKTELSERYSWPIRAIWIVWVGIFFSSGMTKLSMSGFEWFYSHDHINSIFRSHIVFYDYRGFEFLHKVPAFFYKYLNYPQILGIGLVLQLSSPIILFHAKARKYIVSAMFILQFLIWILMALRHFWYFLPVYAFFISWDKCLLKFSKSYRI